VTPGIRVIARNFDRFCSRIFCWLATGGSAGLTKFHPMKTEKLNRFATNIENKGRLLRAAGAGVLGVTALALSWKFPAAAVGLALAAAFLAFEATRGWCALRACGVKTKF